jgi:hypothetical protein
MALMSTWQIIAEADKTMIILQLFNSQFEFFQQICYIRARSLPGCDERAHGRQFYLTGPFRIRIVKEEADKAHANDIGIGSYLFPPIFFEKCIAY